MLDRGQSKLRDWGIFVLIAMLPAVAIGLLGFRALLNEEAAIQREMRLVLEQSAAQGRRQYEAALADLDTRVSESAPFAESLSIAATETRVGPARNTKPAPRHEACQAFMRQLGAGAHSDAVRAGILTDCEDFRSTTGRWLWLVVALTRDVAPSRERLETWLRAHGPELSLAERATSKVEIAAASWLGDADRRALQALLDSGGARAAVAPLQSAQRKAMRLKSPRIRWRHASALGLLIRAENGDYSGFVVHSRSLAGALGGGWPALPDGVAARLVMGPEKPSAASFQALPGGAYIELHYVDPGAVRARTQRSKRILLGVAALASLTAFALVALLFARMRAERRVSALRTDFVAAVSHELRTPIASIRMLSELLAEDRVADEHEKGEMLVALAREAKRLGDTVNRLLGFSRMEAGKQSSERSLAHLATPIKEAIQLAEERNLGRRVAHELDEDIFAPIDSEAVRMAVTNLLTNAFKYAESPISVRLSSERNGARIEVQDSGPGLSKGDQKRVFLPFERADDRLSRATEGSGIGLSLVRHVARSHGGRVGVQSELGRGSTFFLWLPTPQGKVSTATADLNRGGKHAP